MTSSRFRRVRWDPALHPRGPLGRFIDATGTRFESDPGSARYDAEDLLADGTPRLSDAQEVALANYTDFPWVNYNLRYGDSGPNLPAGYQGPENSRDLPDVSDAFRDQGEYLEALDGAIDQGQLDRNLVVSRGMSTGAMDEASAQVWTNLRPGDQIWDRGYVSTTLNPEVAERFGGGVIRSYIELPAGTPVALPGVHNPEFANQEEILVGRGGVFEVQSAHRTADDEHVIRLRLVGYLDTP